MFPQSIARSALYGLLSLIALPILTYGQAITTQSRITQAVDESNTVVLHGNTHPLAQARFDQGAAPDSLPLRRMLLVLKRSPAQEAALDALLDQQQDSTSPNYHKWLTPKEFGQQFGSSDQDIQAITNWLQSHGFTVAGASNGRTVIEFSGTAGQLRETFHTEMHQYTRNGQAHWANINDPQIPVALAPVIAGINTLYSFPRRQMHEFVGSFSRSRLTGQVQPVGSQFTIRPGNNEYFAIAPPDLAKIYNVPNLTLSPVPAAVYNGDGETIAIVGESDIDAQDVNQFRMLFNLPVPAKLTTIVSGPDPGINGAETEGDLDVQWASAVAPNAAIDYVIAESTEVSLGVDLAAQYTVDNNLAPVLNESYGICEFFMGNANNTFYDQLWQQASAEGITVTVSAGDGGATACDQNAGTQGPAQYGLNVSGFTSTPYNVSVGGTDFNDVGNFQSYWNTAPTDTPPIATALGYIPEMTWNDTCTNQEIFAFFDVGSAESSCNNTTEQADGLVAVIGGSGGASNCTQSDGIHESSCSGGYPKPSWQIGTGVPSDGKRDIPDLSLFASNGFNGSFYIVCEADLNPSASSCDPFAGVSDFVGIGGTSASSPIFSGIMVLINQATGSRQGNANYILYKLASQNGNTCSSVATTSSTCVFYDVPGGSTIQMPCVNGTLNCVTTSSTDANGVLSGYGTTPGYDLATGLGSVNAGNLISKWISFTSVLSASKTTLNLDSGAAVNITHGQSITAVVNVAPIQGPGTPTGTISLTANPGSTSEQVVAISPLINGSASFSTTSLPGGTNYAVFASYSGDGTFAPSVSDTTFITVAPEQSRVSVAYELFDANGNETSPNATSASFGQFSILHISVSSQSGDVCPTNSPGNSGCPTGTITLTDNGNPLDGGVFNLNSQGYADDKVISLSPGAHQLSAVYSGDNSFTGSLGNGVITINKTGTSVTLSSNTTTWKGTDGVYLTATVATNIHATNSGSLPTGTIEILMDGNTVFVQQLAVTGSVNSQTGTAQATAGVDFAASYVTVGQHTFVAMYSGDANYAAGSSTNLTVTDIASTRVNVALTSAGQNSSNIVITAGLQWTIAVLGSANVPTPTGTIQFNLSAATGSLLGSAAVSNSLAQITTQNSSIPSGATVYATYGGDANYSPSTGSVTLSSLLLNTGIALTSSNLSPAAGNPITFVARLTPASGGPTPTGSITFFSPSPANLSISDVKSISNNQAQDTFSLWTGPDSVSAIYSGDSNYAPSTTTLVENVSGITTATSVASSNPSARVGGLVTFIANVTATESGTPAPAGGVFFSANGTPLGAAALSNGQAALSLQNLAAGNYSILASYGGDFNHSPSSSSITQMVGPAASSTTVTSSSPTITQGSAVTLTARVSQAGQSEPIPTGSVEFAANGRILDIVSVVNGGAQLITSSLPQGSITITASYSGDFDYTGSLATFTQTVNAPPSPAFSVTANPPSLTISAPGQSVSTTVVFTSKGGLAGFGGLSNTNCGTVASEEITCSLSSFTLPPNGTAQATLTFQSTAASQSLDNLHHEPRLIVPDMSRSLFLVIISMVAALAFAQHRKYCWRSFFLPAVLIGVLFASVSCGGGGGSGSNQGGGGNSGGQTFPGTPIGAVQPLSVSVTIDGVTQTISNLTVTVE